MINKNQRKFNFKLSDLIESESSEITLNLI